MVYLLVIALITLLVDVTLDTGFIVLRPFILVVGLMIIFSIYRLRQLSAIQMTNGFLILIPFFLYHVISAFTYNLSNGMREALATSTIFITAGVLASYAPIINYHKLHRLITAAFILIMTAAAGWHIANGYLIGWKHLDNLKATFVFIPMVFACALVTRRPEDSRTTDNLLYYLGWLILGVLIVMSGERKAWLVYGVLSVAMLGRGQVLKMIPFLVVGISAFWLIAQSVDNSYLQTQLRSIDPTHGLHLTVDDIAAGETPVSLSNAQRAFAAKIGLKYFAKAPIFGIGTNVYRDLIQEQLNYLPKFLIADIHNEYLRVLIENGFLGIVCYLSIWIFALYRFGKVRTHLYRIGKITRTQARVFPYVLYFPSFVYLLFEGSGLQSFIVLVIISLTPDFFYWARTQRPEPQTYASPVYKTNSSLVRER